jgi:cobalt/nickel transport system permease protein
MADALLSPVVGGVMLLSTVGVGTYAVRQLQDQLEDKKVPLMGVMGAFIFASQMINFTIPGTGSSGHIAGGLLLSVLLGPSAGFLTMAALLLIQALFFGDGGLLAYGANVFNLGFFACFIAYPLIYKRMTQEGQTPRKIWVASLVASVIALQLGSFAVVIETVLSGKTELPFGTFLLLMQPIHLAIGVVEGLITASVITFIWAARPELLDQRDKVEARKSLKFRTVYVILLALCVFIGGTLSWFASSNPDGLEWSIFHTTGSVELESTDPIHHFFEELQSQIVPFPDYAFKTDAAPQNETAEESWPNISSGTSFSGLVGGTLTFVLALLMGWIIVIIKKRK